MLWNDQDEKRIREQIRQAEIRIGVSAVEMIRRAMQELANKRRHSLNENRLESFFDPEDRPDARQ